MNIIQVLLAGTFCITAAGSVQAQQQLKTQVATENISTVPAPGSKPAGDAKTIAAATQAIAAPVPVETPSPFTKEKNGTATPDSKPVLSAEQAKILAGTAERPKQAVTTAVAPVAPELKPAATAPVPLMIKTQ